MQLKIEATTTTPSVTFDPATGVLEFSGQSYPEDSVPFYQEIQDELAAHLEKSSQPLIIAFKLNYFNTSSSKCLLTLLESVERFQALRDNVRVRWYYEEDDEDMHSSGIDFSLDILLPFEFIPVEQLVTT